MDGGGLYCGYLTVKFIHLSGQTLNNSDIS